nr:histone deacetylase 14 [Quercus suber]
MRSFETVKDRKSKRTGDSDEVFASRNCLDPPVGFALIIPPGHHPIPKGPTGLCFRKCGHCSSLCPTFTWAKRMVAALVLVKNDEVGHGDGEGTEIKFAYTWRVR